MKQIEKYKEELEKAKKFKKENPKGKDIGVLLSMKSGREYLTLSSGVLEEYKSALIIRNKRIDDLYNEIKIIKKLKV